MSLWFRATEELPHLEVEAFEVLFGRAQAQFRLVGKDVPRVDVPGKVNGTALYSIDVQLPGMIYGAILREPVEGAAPEKIDDSAARTAEGVIQIVPLKYGVGVLADSPWAAFKAKDALKVTWSRKAKGWGFSNEKGYEQFAAVAKISPRKASPGETRAMSQPPWPKLRPSLRASIALTIVITPRWSRPNPWPPVQPPVTRWKWG